MTGTTDQTTQFNLGAGARIAGHTYREATAPDSIKVYLATTPSDQLDEEAIDNERLFYYRFSMDGPRKVREQFIELKRKYDFTDAEIRWLRRSGQLRIRRTTVEVRPDKLLPAMGWFYLALTLLVFVTCTLAVGGIQGNSWQKPAIMAAICAGAFSASWLIIKAFIAPWKWLRETGAR